MARARNIKPALFKNELLGVADPLLTLLFQSLWTLADKEGRLEDRPLRIKAETFPYREGLDVNGYLTELERMGFIVRYTVGASAIIQVVNFKKHQTPHNTEKASDLPPVEAGIVAPRGLREITVKPPLSNGENINALPPDSGFLTPDSLVLTPDSSVPKGTGSKPPMSADEIIFSYGLGMLTNAGTADKQARSFLGGLRKGHGDEALVNALRECAKAKPLQPLEWLAAALPPGGSSKAKPGKHSGFQQLNYMEGIEEDGTFS